MLTQSKLLELLTYDKDTGKFYWKISKRTGLAGTEAGTVDSDGYRVIRIDGRGYKAHRLAWLFVTGHWPLTQLDHKDQDKLNNRYDNLRELSAADQMVNVTPANVNSSSGYRNVSWYTALGKWKGTFMRHGKKIFVGHFDCPKAAYEAVQAKKLEVCGASK